MIDRRRKQLADKKAAKRLKGSFLLCDGVEPTQEELSRFKGIFRKTGKTCSSPACCGNPRRMRGQSVPTLQEKRHNEANGWRKR